MEDRDQYRQKEGDMNRDMSEKEASPGVFEGGGPQIVAGNPDSDQPVVGTMGDSRPDQVEPHGSHFVDATADPNLHVTRRTEDLTAPSREGADELAHTRHDDSKIVARPMGPLGNEGAELRPVSADAKEAEEGDDS